MTFRKLVLLLLFLQILRVSTLGGSEDRFIKKYAMMKIYESCFGPEVVRQIRKEMKAACAKCAALEIATNAQTGDGEPSAPKPDAQPAVDPDNSVYSAPPNFDAEKLHQAILAFRPNLMQDPLYRPYPTSVYPQPYPLPYQNPLLIYPGYQPPSQFGQMSLPFVGHPFYGNRMSREMDIKSQLEMLTSRMSGRVRNVTCVMQELGYLDNNFEPNYPKINERINNLPISDELRKDMQDGVTFCQQFSQCVPEMKKDRSPLSREFIKPMFFFKCYKHKKLEACIMKDVREKYSGVADDDFDNDMDLRRNGKSIDLPQTDREIDQLASSMYEFLYGSDSNVDIDTVL